MKKMKGMKEMKRMGATSKYKKHPCFALRATQDKQSKKQKEELFNYELRDGYKARASRHLISPMIRYNGDMTTITFQKPLKLNRSRFRDLEGFMVHIRVLEDDKPQLPSLSGKDFIKKWWGAFSPPSKSTLRGNPRMQYLTKKHLSV